MQKHIILGVRCEALSVEEEDVKKGKNLVNVTVSHFEELGNETLIYGDLDSNASKFGTTKTGVIIKATSNHGYRPGDVIKAYVNLDKAHYFDSKTEVTILPRIPSESVIPAEIKGGKIHLIDTKIDVPTAMPLEEGRVNLVAPIDSISLGEGPYKAKVAKVEVVEGKHLVYLSYGEELIFVIGDDTIKVGDEIKFSIDLEKVTIETKDNENVLLPLVDKDTVFSTFVNFKTAYGVTQKDEFLKIRDESVRKVVEEYEAKEKALLDARDTTCFSR